MSGSESDSPAPSDTQDTEFFVERDDKETMLGYGTGRMPIVIGIIWVAFIICYVTVMAILALPDFQAWSNR